MSNVDGNRVIPNNLDALRRLVRPVLQRFKTQINKETASYRSIGKRAGISHEQVRLMVQNPEKNLSRKTMIKLVQRCTKRQLILNKKPIHHIGNGMGIWNKDVI